MIQSVYDLLYAGLAVVVGAAVVGAAVVGDCVVAADWADGCALDCGLKGVFFEWHFSSAHTQPMLSSL